MNLADRLRDAMAARGMTQKQLADAVGVKPPSVNGWLSSKARFLRGENLLKAAAALGVEQEWLATGAGPRDLDSPGDRPAASQSGRPDLATLARAMRLLSFVSRIQGVRFDISDENADVLLMAYDLVSLSPSDFDLEDASTRMGEWLRARGQDGALDRRKAVGSRRKVISED